MGEPSESPDEEDAGHQDEPVERPRVFVPSDPWASTTGAEDWVVILQMAESDDETWEIIPDPPERPM